MKQIQINNEKAICDLKKEVGSLANEKQSPQEKFCLLKGKVFSLLEKAPEMTINRSENEDPGYYLEYANLLGTEVVLAKKIVVTKEDKAELGKLFFMMAKIYQELDSERIKEFVFEGLEMYQKIHLENSLEMAEIYFIAGSLCIYCDVKQVEEASTLLQKALAIREDILEETHELIAYTYYMLGKAYLAQCKISTLAEKKAIKHFEKAVSICPDLKENQHVNIPDIYKCMACVYGYLKDYDHAIEYYLKEITYIKEHGKERKDIPYYFTNSGNLYYSYMELLFIYRNYKKITEMVSCYMDAFQEALQIQEDNRELLDFCRLWNHEEYYATAKGDVTWTDLEKVVDTLLAQMDYRKFDETDICTINLFLGKAYEVLGDLENATAYYKLAWKYIRANVETHFEWRDQLGIMYMGQEAYDEAISYYMEAIGWLFTMGDYDTRRRLRYCYRKIGDAYQAAGEQCAEIYYKKAGFFE